MEGFRGKTRDMSRNTPREINPDDAHSIAPDMIGGDEARAPAKDGAERRSVETEISSFIHTALV